MVTAIGEQSVNMKLQIKVVFLVHNIATWDCLHDVYTEMVRDPDFEPLVVSIPRHFPGVEAFGHEEETFQALRAVGIEPLRFNDPDSFKDLEHLKALAPDIIFRQSHWEGDVPPAFRTKQISFARLCYVPYGIMGMVSDKNCKHHKSGFHEACWKIFLANKVEYVEVAKGRSQGKVGCHIVGHPSIEAVLRAQPSWPIENPAGQRNYRVIWAAHHSIWGTWLRYGTFPYVHKSMLAWATASQDIDFVFRPHPALLSMLEPLKISTSQLEIDAFFEAWNALPNTYVSHEEVYASLFAASDLLITDGIGFLLEYQLCRKPILFFARQDREPLMPGADIIERGVHMVGNVQQAVRMTLAFKHGLSDRLRHEQDLVCDTLLRSRQSAQAIVQRIKQDF